MNTTEAIPLWIQDYLGEPDSTTSQWFLLNTPKAFVSVICIYFGTIYLLSKHMEKRKPLELRNWLISYNASQVILSAYICKELAVTSYTANYTFKCSPYLHPDSDLFIRMASAFWLFYLSKVYDLCDTMFFVLRKKQNQLTFLHLYHHSSMIFNWYLGVLYTPGGQGFLAVLFNSFVHTVMYSYYMMAAMGPHMQKYLWWKRYLTQLQLVQFVVLVVHLMVGLWNNCKSPYWLNWFTIIYLVTLIGLFSNFYYQSYKKKLKLRGKVKEPVKIDYGAAGDFKY